MDAGTIQDVIAVCNAVFWLSFFYWMHKRKGQ